VPAVEVIPSNEAERMAAVRRYDILDTPPDGAFDRIAALASRLLSAPIAIVSIVDTDRIWFKSHHGLDVTEIGRDPGLCASAILGEGPWIVTDAAHDPRTLANPLVAGDFGLRFYAGVPLTTHDGFNLGTLCVIDTEPRSISDAGAEILGDLAALVVDELELRLSARAAVGQADARLHDVEHLARALQQSLLPPTLPEIPFLQMAAKYQPASTYEVGGDFYDVFPLDDRSWGVVIGDVCGKGAEAAGRTSCARYSMRAAAIHQPSPSDVLRMVNAALLADVDPSAGIEAPFVTALFARVEPAADGVTVRLASGGHPLALLVRADGRVLVAGEAGTLLGVVPKIDAVDTEVQLRAGDALVLVTDGVLDSGRPRRLEQEGLVALLGSCGGAPPAEIVDAVHRAVANAQRDDIAILVLAPAPS
jgi:sigma-B regulation protein RsbU (phosphoserine phosphatase)